MSTFLAIIGGIVVLCVVLIITAIAVGIAADRAEKLVRHIEARGETNRMEQTRISLSLSACWFSEDPATQRLIEDIANDQHLHNIGEVRERWRRGRASELNGGRVQ